MRFGHMTERADPRPATVHACAGDDLILPGLLNPETSAVSMEIRWFKGTDCVFLYLNGQVTEGRGYEGRVSLITHELQRGNVSLTLREVQESDGGDYRCEVTCGKLKLTNSGVHLQISVIHYYEVPHVQPRYKYETKVWRHTKAEEENRRKNGRKEYDLQPKKPERRWSFDGDRLNM
ncbi:butyrophilin-like protein 1 [Brachyhypopomus gauderio]|uniref:butyrophilin-like protein 1 n=1 Tax=Brachyhypopomus gauderio TaxID=698409 RepID=UPI0040416843